MVLPAPNLDDRTFRQLVEEAKQRIPRFTPEWTDFNESDPGMTLIQLHAWLTETILYRLNQVPDLNYIKFLNLLNVQPRPAQAARAELTFKLKKLNDIADPLVVLIPKSTQIAVDDPELQQPLVFETESTLTAINAALATVVVPGTGGERQRVTEYDNATGETKFPHTFRPFGDAPAVNTVCMLGFMVRPHRKKDIDYSLDRFPAGKLDVMALIPEPFDSDASGEPIPGPLSMQGLFPAQVHQNDRSIVWEAYFGIDHLVDFASTSDRMAWREVPVARDDTVALTRSGHIELEMPGGMPAVPFERLSRDFWASLSLTKPPTTAGELADDISDGTIAPADLDDSVWVDLGITGNLLSELQGLLGDPVANRAAIVTFVRARTLNFNRVAAQVWLDASDVYDESLFKYELSWLRARLVSVPDEPPQVMRFVHNTVAALAAVTRFEEVLGSSNGRPSQAFRLGKTPVLIDTTKQLPRSELSLVVREGDESEEWSAVTDFYFGRSTDAKEAADRAVFVLDPDSGTVTFGDGIHGRIPVAGSSIVAARYRFGGGAVGNAGAGTIKSLKSSVPHVESVTNLRAAAGGANAESLEEAKLRAPHDLRHRDRAVTADDFAELARQVPGVPVQRAFALPLTRAERVAGSSPPRFNLVGGHAGAVTVVVLPQNRHETPQPTEAQLRLICSYLNERRLITTELFVCGPNYLVIDKLKAQVFVDRQADLKTAGDAIRELLVRYFHPLRGGEDGGGWPFGQDVLFGHVYRQLLGVNHVTRVQCLEITPAGSSEPCSDVIPVPDGSLVYLPRTALNVEVSYDTRG